MATVVARLFSPVRSCGAAVRHAIISKDDAPDFPVAVVSSGSSTMDLAGRRDATLADRWTAAIWNLAEAREEPGAHPRCLVPDRTADEAHVPRLTSEAARARSEIASVAIRRMAGMAASLRLVAWTAVGRSPRSRHRRSGSRHRVLDDYGRPPRSHIHGTRGEEAPDAMTPKQDRVAGIVSSMQPLGGLSACPHLRPAIRCRYVVPENTPNSRPLSL